MSRLGLFMLLKYPAQERHSVFLSRRIVQQTSMAAPTAVLEAVEEGVVASGGAEGAMVSAAGQIFLTMSLDRAARQESAQAWEGRALHHWSALGGQACALPARRTVETSCDRDLLPDPVQYKPVPAPPPPTRPSCRRTHRASPLQVTGAPSVLG